MSLWSKLGWRHWLLKHLDHLKTHSALRIWCWIMRSFKNDRAQTQFWTNCWLQSRLTHKHGWRLTDNGCAPIPTANQGSERAVLSDIPKAMSSLSYHCMRRKTRLTADGYRLNSCSHREQGLSVWREPFCVAYQIKAVSSISSQCKRRSLVLSNELLIISLHCQLGWWHGGRVWLVAQRAVTIWFSSLGSLSPRLTCLRCQCFVKSPISPGENREALYKVYTRTSA